MKGGENMNEEIAKGEQSLKLNQESSLGLRDPEQWSIWEDPSRRDETGSPIKLHRIKPDLPKKPGMSIEEATLASKEYLSPKGEKIKFRLLIGGPDQKLQKYLSSKKHLRR